MPFLRTQNSPLPESIKPLTAETLVFSTYWAANVSILELKPGRGILLTCTNEPSFKEVTFMVGRDLYVAPLHDDGRISVEEIGGIDPRGWEFEGETWVADQLNCPTLVEVIFHNFGAVEDLFFVHDDCEIRDPTLSECGRFSVKPTEYGFARRAGDDHNWYRPVTKGTLVLTKTQLVLVDAQGAIVAVRDIADIPMPGDLED
ncbi:TPA: hypothetical protein ACP32N_005084 [Pseudomonas aeruginosa]